MLWLQINEEEEFGLSRLPPCPARAGTARKGGRTTGGRDSTGGLKVRSFSTKVRPHNSWSRVKKGGGRSHQ